MKSIAPKVGLALLLAYVPGADTFTHLAEKYLDKRISALAVQVYNDYTSGDNQAAADHGREAVRLNEEKNSLCSFASKWFPSHIISKKQRERRQFLSEHGWDYHQ